MLLQPRDYPRYCISSATYSLFYLRIRLSIRCFLRQTCKSDQTRLENSVRVHLNCGFLPHIRASDAISKKLIHYRRINIIIQKSIGYTYMSVNKNRNGMIRTLFQAHCTLHAQSNNSSAFGVLILFLNHHISHSNDNRAISHRTTNREIILRLTIRHTADYTARCREPCGLLACDQLTCDTKCGTFPEAQVDII